MQNMLQTPRHFIIKDFVTKHWYLPLLIMLTCYLIGAGILLYLPAKAVLYNTSQVFVIFGFLQGIGFTLYQLRQKNIRQAVLQAVIGGLISGGALIFFGLFLSLYSYDFYADNLTIPQNINFAVPIHSHQCSFDCVENENNFHMTTIPAHVSKPDFYLYDGMQGGIYQYDVYLGNIKKGEVYLKAFEITHNDPLSSQSLAFDSKIAVENPTQTIQKFSLNGDFTIYEGDWDKYYGSRFELWFRPADKTKPERRLMTKNFIIQGWMR